MQTTTDTDFEVIEHLDFEPPCEDVDNNGEPADWVLKCKGCGHLTFICEPHRAELVRWVARGSGANHTRCGLWGLTYEDLFYVIPVKGMH